MTKTWEEDIAGVRTCIQLEYGYARATYFGSIPWDHPFHEALRKRSEEIMSVDGPMYESDVLNSTAGAA